jgi:hypothetical protein
MFIHFDSSVGEECDNCGRPHTIMHMSTGHRDRSINLCLGCVSALAQVLGHASKKLRLGGYSESPLLTSPPLAS